MCGLCCVPQRSNTLESHPLSLPRHSFPTLYIVLFTYASKCLNLDCEPSNIDLQQYFQYAFICCPYMLPLLFILVLICASLSTIWHNLPAKRKHFQSRNVSNFICFEFFILTCLYNFPVFVLPAKHSGT